MSITERFKNCRVCYMGANRQYGCHRLVGIGGAAVRDSRNFIKLHIFRRAGTNGRSVRRVGSVINSCGIINAYYKFRIQIKVTFASEGSRVARSYDYSLEKRLTREKERLELPRRQPSCFSPL